MITKIVRTRLNEGIIDNIKQRFGRRENNIVASSIDIPENDKGELGFRVYYREKLRPDIESEMEKLLYSCIEVGIISDYEIGDIEWGSFDDGKGRVIAVEFSAVVNDLEELESTLETHIYNWKFEKIEMIPVL